MGGGETQEKRSAEINDHQGNPFARGICLIFRPGPALHGSGVHEVGRALKQHMAQVTTGAMVIPVGNACLFGSCDSMGVE